MEPQEPRYDQGLARCSLNDRDVSVRQARIDWIETILLDDWTRDMRHSQEDIERWKQEGPLAWYSMTDLHKNLLRELDNVSRHQLRLVRPPGDWSVVVRHPASPVRRHLTSGDESLKTTAYGKWFILLDTPKTPIEVKYFDECLDLVRTNASLAMDFEKLVMRHGSSISQEFLSTRRVTHR